MKIFLLISLAVALCAAHPDGGKGGQGGKGEKGICHHHHSMYEGKSGPAHWHVRYPDCGGSAQSPIDVVTAAAQCGAGQGAPQVTIGAALSGHVFNNGHTVEADATSAGMTVLIGDRSFAVEQFHFHWGTSNGRGSEHKVNGQPADMEMHVVCGRNNNEELAVLSFLLEADAVDNAALAPVVDALPKIDQDGQKTGLTMSVAELGGLLAEAMNGGPYFRYQGSLTTPPCSEIVTWTVYQNKVKVGNSQLAAFRQTSVGGDNFRPVQPVNGRTVFNSAC